MRPRHGVLAVALAAVALAIVWRVSSSSPPDAIAHARQAFGTAPEVHVVASVGIDPNAPPMRPITSSESIEVWYEATRRRTHAVVRRGTTVTLDCGAECAEGLEPANVPPVAEVPPLLWGFVTGYRSKLAAGRYHPAGSDRIEGRRVLWLSSPTLDPVDVAVDPVSYQPLWLRSSDSTLLTQLSVAETRPYDPADFLTAKQKRSRHL